MINTIKEYVKSLNYKLFYPENITLSKINDYNKLHHNNDFICYVHPNDDTIPESHIKKHILKLKHKITTCIICITNNDTELISIILNEFVKLDKYNIIIISPNTNHLQFAIEHNINYIISLKNDYMSMISTCLLNIKSSNIFNDNIFITNTETIIHHTLIPTIINNHKKDSIISLPSTLKHINLTTGQMYNIIIPLKTVTPNWFVINRNIQISLLNNINNVNIQQIQVTGTICTNFPDKKYINSNIIYSLDDVKTLSLLSEYSSKVNVIISTIINKLANTIPTQIIEIDNSNKNNQIVDMTNRNFKTYTIQNNNIVTYNSIVNRFYFINISPPHQTIVKNTFKPSTQQIITQPQFLANVNAIKDAQKNNFNYVCIIDGSVLSDEIFKIFNDNDIPFFDIPILILIPEKTIESDININTNTNKLLTPFNLHNQKLTNFSYCIHKRIYDIYLDNLIKHNNIVTAIEETCLTNTDIFVFRYASKSFFSINNNSLDIVKTNSNNNTIKPLYNYVSIIKSNTQNIRELTKIKINPQFTQGILPTISMSPLYNKILSRVIPIKQNKKIIEPAHTYTIIQSMFTGSYLSKTEVSSILSFITHNHIYHLYAYKKILNVPVGCIIKNANDILPYDETKLSDNLSKNRLNAFKFKLLFMKGNYWVGLTVICNKKFDFTEQYMFVHNSDLIIKCPAGSKFALDCYNGAINNTYQNMHSYIELHKLSKYIKQNIENPQKNTLQNTLQNTLLFNNKSTNFINNKPSQQNIWAAQNGISLLEDNNPWYVNQKNKMIQNNITQPMSFNLESIYGKYNNVGVLFYWMPANNTLINGTESLFNLNLNSTTFSNTSHYVVNVNPATANPERINHFIKNDIYIYMMTRMLELKLIKKLHIIFGMTQTDKYLYNNDPLFTNGNYYKHTDDIHLWKLNDIQSVLSFSHAKLYMYKGYGNYEHLFSWLTYISPNSLFLRYLATSFPLVKSGTKIVIDDDWISNDYANNKKIKLINKNYEYFKKHYTNYDILLMDTASKILNYKKLFPNTKTFIKFYKYSLMHNTHSERVYDLMFCASDAHPSKNWDIFNDFLYYCNRNNKKINVLITTPVVSDKTFDEYKNLKNIKIVVKKNLIYSEMIEAYNSSKCLLITFGRDAAPRAMTEAAKCGCFNIVLDILSDGQDMVLDNGILGKVINVPENRKSYQESYKSIKCDLTNVQYDEIYNLVNANYDHKLITDEFKKKYDEITVTKNIYELAKEIVINKNKLIVTLATENYSNNLNYLLSSIKCTNPNVNVLVYCVGWRNFLLSQFKTIYPNYYFREYTLDNWVKGDIIKLKVKIQRDVYLEFDYNFVWIDADSIVLGNLDKLFKLIPNYGLICYYRPDNEYYMKFAVGVIAYGKSKNEEIQKMNLEFINTYYNNSLVVVQKDGWFGDQISLYETWVQFKDKIKLYELNENEHSINDTLNTIVYSRRIDNKHRLHEILKMKNIIIPNINYNNIKMVYF